MTDDMTKSKTSLVARSIVKQQACHEKIAMNDFHSQEWASRGYNSLRKVTDEAVRVKFKGLFGRLLTSPFCTLSNEGVRAFKVSFSRM